MIDTRTIGAARIMYIGSALKSVVEKMTDHFGKQAFIPIHQYAAAGTILNGEIGTVGEFRIVVVPEMLHWAGDGATETEANAGYRAENGKYNVYPMLVVGDGSFTTIGFQTDGKTVKFKIYHKKPGKDTVTKDDPYGESGLMSIKWWYGFMALRAERIAVVKTVAEQ
jgi:N4-gp56 family major capsid protein